MFSISLKPITDRLPLDRGTRRRLERIVTQANAQKHALTFEHLHRKVGSIPPELLSMILDRLVELGLVKRVIRVESPTTKVGLGDYSNVEDIPPMIFDDDANQQIVVTPDDLRVIYKF